MGFPVRWWLLSAGSAAMVGASLWSQGAVASAVSVAPDGHAFELTASTAAPYVPPSQNIYYGASGAAVTSVQERLAQLGYYPGPIDGEYGPDLQQAVWAFKGVQGLSVAGGNSVMGPYFRQDLVNPKPPPDLVPNGGANRIEIDQSMQVLVLYRNNQPYLILHVSTGGRYYYCSTGGCGYAITPDGNYQALSYLPGMIAVPLGFMENPVFFIGRAYAIHGGDPVPWYPASHGCVRIYADAVAWFHNDVTIGVTNIYVRGTAP
ncbi:MAG TPA: L,D-transpeptidase family protein [Streptosporangiaceae bacterium]|nr:L,D-transpeptidase family protein [Streptosporangiaceae bacterium]